MIVDFLEGDPDQPIITGRVYNAEQMPPYDLPANTTQSGIKSRSSARAAARPTSTRSASRTRRAREQLCIHAEKNQDIEVENDETHWVGHDRTKTIDHDETTHVKHDRTETVDNNETITVHGNRTETVGQERDDHDPPEPHRDGRPERDDHDRRATAPRTVGTNETITIGAQPHASRVGASETATVALQRTHTVGANETITVGAAQEITVGAAQTDDRRRQRRRVNVGADQTHQRRRATVVDARSASDEIARRVGEAAARTSVGKDDALDGRQEPGHHRRRLDLASRPAAPASR